MNKTQKLNEILTILEHTVNTLELHSLAIKMLKDDVETLKGFEKKEYEDGEETAAEFLRNKIRKEISDLEYSELAEKDKRDFYETSRGV